MNDDTKDLGSTRGKWWIAMLAIGITATAVFVVLILVKNDQLARGWAYAVLPVAIVAAALPLVLTVFKANAESKRPSDET